MKKVRQVSAFFIFYFVVSEIMRTFAPVFITCLTTKERSNYAIILQQSAKGKPARPEITAIVSF